MRGSDYFTAVVCSSLQNVATSSASIRVLAVSAASAALGRVAMLSCPIAARRPRLRA